MSTDAFTNVTGNFLAHLSDSLSAARFPHSNLLVRNGSFIAILPDDGTEIENAIVHHRVAGNGKRLLAGVIDDKNATSDESATSAYASVFAKCLLKRYQAYVVELVAFSKKRDIGDRKLYQDTHFRQVVGDVLKDLELAELSLSDSAANLSLAFQLLTRISHHCSRVLGGRSLLTGSIFDLQVICHLIENTYVK